MSAARDACGERGCVGHHVLCQLDLRNHVFPDLSIAAYCHFNPGLAHVSHVLIVKLGFVVDRVTGVAKSGAYVALNLGIGRSVGGAVFDVMVFTFNRLMTRAGHAEVEALIVAVLTTGDYAARKAGDQWRVLAAFFVLRQAELRSKQSGHNKQKETTKYFHGVFSVSMMEFFLSL